SPLRRPAQPHPPPLPHHPHRWASPARAFRLTPLLPTAATPQRASCTCGVFASGAPAACGSSPQIENTTNHAIIGPGQVSRARAGRPSRVSELQAALTKADFWKKFESDWFCLDAELMPWSATAQELLRSQYAPVGAAS